jgi:mannan endo-1,4-beta-mannosidase
LKVRLITTAVLAVGCAALSACASPAYPYAAPPGASRSAKPVRPVTAPPPPAKVVGIYNNDLPRSYTLVDHFAKAVGAQPNVVMYFSDWHTLFKTPFAETARKNGAVPFVEMQPFGRHVMAKIVAGRFDIYLRKYAQEVRSYRGRVMIGFAHEMNGNWYPWGATHIRPKVFREAWRHIVTIFRQAGDLNVTWLWIINGLAIGEAPIREWWPGSRYVDWVGVDAYYDQPTQIFRNVFDPTFAAIRKLTKKPILIAETGIGPTAGQAAKLPDLFAGVERTKNLRGFVYYDQFQNSGIYHQDWQIDNDPLALAAFGKGAKQYLG